MPDSESGLIYAYVFDRKGGARRIDWAGVRAFDPSEGVLWIHLDYTCEESLKWLIEHSAIDSVVREGLLADQPRPRATVEDDGLLFILRSVNMNPGSEPEDMVALRMWLDKDHIVSLRHRIVKSVRVFADQIESGKAPSSVSQTLVTLIELALEELMSQAHQVEDEVWRLEDMVVQAESEELRHPLADLRRKAIALRRYIAPEREVETRLQTLKVPWLDAEARAHLRECAERLTRIVEDLDAARDRAAVTQEELSNRLSELANRRLYVVSILATIFVPVSFLTGLLGVNVGGIPGRSHPSGFAILCGAMVVTVIVQIIVFRNRRWL